MSEPEISAVGVGLKQAPYTVWIGDGLLAYVGEKTRAVCPAKRAAILTDTNVEAIYADAVRGSMEAAGFECAMVSVPPGERSKSLECCAGVIDRLVDAGLDRGSVLVALGGGVVGDLAGFVASIYYRGIPYVQVPTTVVAQVDSSVGGKTGVNATGGKNLIGAFHHPVAVVADPATLASLPEREFNEGFAEIIKHAVIRDAEMLDALDPAARNGLAGLVARNVAIKSRIVEADEKELTGERALLNFGHTVGHAVEQAAGYGTLLHGEAISVGIRAALALSERVAGLAPHNRAKVEAALDAFALPARIPPGIRAEAVLSSLAKDKKFVEGATRFVLTEQLGSAFVSSAVSLAEIESVVKDLGAD